MNIKNRFINLAILTSLVIMLAFGVTQPVQAFETNNNGRIARDVVIDDDLLIAANSVVIDGTVNGMVLAAGNDIIINGTVNGDVLAGASSVTVSEGAVITGNLFTGAQTVVVNGRVDGSVLSGVMSLVFNSKSSVGRNVYFGGYNLETKSGAKIGQDLAAGGYQVILDGEIARDVKAAVAAFKLNGSIGRNADIQVEKPGPGPGILSWSVVSPDRKYCHAQSGTRYWSRRFHWREPGLYQPCRSIQHHAIHPAGIYRLPDACPLRHRIQNNDTQYKGPV